MYFYFTEAEDLLRKDLFFILYIFLQIYSKCTLWKWAMLTVKHLKFTRQTAFSEMLSLNQEHFMHNNNKKSESHTEKEEFCTKSHKIISYIMLNRATGHALSHLTLCIHHHEGSPALWSWKA